MEAIKRSDLCPSNHTRYSRYLIHGQAIGMKILLYSGVPRVRRTKKCRVSGITLMRAASTVRAVGAVRSIEGWLAHRVICSWNIHARVLREEIVRFEHQINVLNWHDRPILRARNVSRADSEVEHDVLVLDASVSIFDPSANRVLRLLTSLWDVLSTWPHPATIYTLLISYNPQRLVSK